MDSYTYTAQTTDKRMVQSTIEAKSKTDAKDVLESQGLTVTKLEKQKSSGGKKGFSFGVPIIEKANLCRYLATMVSAGLSLPEAIDVYSQDTSNPRLKAILIEAERSLQQGQNLSVTLAAYPKVFDPIIVALLKAGERSGTLNESLAYLAEYLFSDYRLKQKIKGALMYPSVILIAMGGVGALLIFFVLPKIAPVFLQLKVSLPFYTRIILQAGLFVNAYALVIIPLLLGLAVAAGVFIMRPTGKKLAIKVASLIPAVRNLLDYLDLARFCRTLSTLLSSGVPISEAVDIVTTSLSQKKFQVSVGTFSEQLQKGISLAQLMREYNTLFPQMTVRMIAAGERSGSIEEMLKESAEFYENEVEDILTNFANVVEPILLLLVGIAVGFMVVAIVGPIYSLVGGLQGGENGL